MWKKATRRLETIVAPVIATQSADHGIPEVDWNTFHDRLAEGAPHITPTSHQLRQYPTRTQDTWQLLADQVTRGQENDKALEDAMTNITITPSSGSTDPPQKRGRP